MEVVDTAQINSFASNAMQADIVSPLEEAVFILTATQLKDIIEKAVLEAVAPLQNRIELLAAIVNAQNEKIASLEATQDTQAENQYIQFKLINDLQEATKKYPQPMQKDRADVLRALLAANGGKMLAKQARQKMHLRKDLFSQLLKACVDFIELKPYHLDRRQAVIILKNELV